MFVNTDMTSIRENFFFCDFKKALLDSIEDGDLKAYPIPTARVPIMKVTFKDKLYIDLSFAIISNNELDDNLPTCLYLPYDEPSIKMIQAVMIC